MVLINGRMALLGLMLFLPAPIIISWSLGDAFHWIAFLVGAAGFLIMIWSLLRRSQKEMHYYEEESSRSWKAGALLAMMAALLLFALTGAAAVVNPSVVIAPLIGCAVLLIFASRYANRIASSKRVTERFAPKRYPCPNCGQMVDRLERSCLQCGAVVWTVFAPRPGTYQMTKTRGRKKITDLLEVNGPSFGQRSQ